MAGQRTSVYLADELADAVKASGVPIADLIRRGLAAAVPAVAAKPVRSGALPAGAIGILGPGVLSHGVACFTPACWQRDTSKYGLRDLPLCIACAYAATGQEYQRPMPDGAAERLARMQKARAAARG